MNKLKSVFARYWRPAAAVLLLALIAYLLFFHSLGSLLPGYTAAERSAYQSAGSLHTITANPLNLPYKAVLYALQAGGQHGLLSTRIAAAIFSVLAGGLFFGLARSWFGYRVGLLAAILFATSSGFLHVARFGSPLILQSAGILLIILCAIWFDHPQHSRLMRYLTAAAAALLLYIPGMALFELLALFFVWPRVAAQGRDTALWHRAGSIALLLLLLAPLAWGAAHAPSILLTALGLPSHVPNAVTVLRNIGASLAAIGIRSDGPASLWLAHVPLLNVIGLALAAIGTAGFWRFNHRAALYVLAAAALCIVLCSLGGPVSLSILVPILYLLVGAGIYTLLNQWFSVFPRNPIARAAGSGLLCIALAFSVLYHIRAYYIAWPHSPATRAAYRISRP